MLVVNPGRNSGAAVTVKVGAGDRSCSIGHQVRGLGQFLDLAYHPARIKQHAVQEQLGKGRGQILDLNPPH